MAADLLEPEDNDTDDTAEETAGRKMAADVLALTQVERLLGKLTPEVRARIGAWSASKHKDPSPGKDSHATIA